MDSRFTDESSTPAISYQRAPKRTHSKLKVTDNGTSKFFKPVKTLGQGAFAKVKLLSHNDELLVCKKPHEKNLRCNNLDSLKSKQTSIERECAFLQIAYPDFKPVQLVKFPESKTNSFGREMVEFDYRLITPLVPGEDLDKFCKHNTNIDILAYLFLSIAAEARRLHLLGMIHGDLSPRNIMIKPDLTIQFIDFGQTYNTNGEATTAEVDEPRKCYWAPERLNVETCPADTAQDVFTLAHAFTWVLKFSTNIQQQIAFLERYPEIYHFMEAGLNADPAKRPSLHDFIYTPMRNIAVAKLQAMLHLEDKHPARQLLSAESDLLDDHTLFEIMLDRSKNEDIRSLDVLIKFMRQRGFNAHSQSIFDLFYFLTDLINDTALTDIVTNPNDNHRANVHILHAAFELAELAVLRPGSLFPESLMPYIQQSSELNDIFNSLSAQGIIVDPQPSMGCTFM